MKKQMMCAMVVMLALGALANPKAWFQGRGAQEGIKVHGDWVIDVRQPDGTLVTHREFKNALTAEGGGMLVSLLSRTNSPGRWKVTLSGPSSGDEPCTENGLESDTNLRGCAIVEDHGPPFKPFQFRNLALSQVVVTAAQPGLGISEVLGFRLTGNASAQRTSDIHGVATGVTGCGKSVAPSTCLDTVPPLVEWTFTQTPVTPIHVVRGQLIQVTVTISFTTPVQ